MGGLNPGSSVLANPGGSGGGGGGLTSVDVALGGTTSDGPLIADGTVTLTTVDNTTGNATSTKHGWAPKTPADATKFLNGAATAAYAQVKDSDLSTSDVTTNNVTSTKHGFAPKSGADATTFLNGAATPAYAAVKDSDLATTDVTTNNVTSTKHGFAPKSGADATTFLNGAATPAYAAVKDSDLSTSDITTNDVSTTKHGFVPKAPNDTTKFLRGDATWAVPSGGGSTLDGAACHMASDYTISDSTLTAIPWDTEDYDNGGLHSTSSNQSRFTIQSTGYYLVTANLTYAGFANGRRTCEIHVNGVATRLYSEVMATPSAAGGDQPWTPGVSGVLLLSATDYVEVKTYQNQGASRNIIANRSYVSVQKITS